MPELPRSKDAWRITYDLGFPDRFRSIEDGAAFCQSFFRWYN